MTRNEFAVLCGKYLIHPSIALENEAIREALARRNDDEIERILREEF